MAVLPLDSIGAPARPAGSGPAQRRAAFSLPDVGGDANSDGVVDARDAAAVVDAILQTRLLSIQGFRNADLDQDGVLTVLDVARIVRIYSRR